MSVLQPTPAPVDSARDLQRRFGVSGTVASWLLSRGWACNDDTGRFLEPRLSHLTRPDAMVGRLDAARRIAQALRTKERIVVFGDYDCDGITATAILTEALRILGGNVEPLLASRFEGGYGVSARALSNIRTLEPRLVITCDCGSSDHPSLAQLKEAAIDVVVIDHHLVPDEPLPVLAFLNPHRPECGFPYKGLASCGLALSVVAAVRAELGVELDVKRWLDLVAIGTIADVAPLDGDNRALVRAGLAMLAQAQRPGLRALLAGSNVSLAGPLTARDVSFRIAPQLNAPGRMGSPTLALQLLLAADESSASVVAAELAAVTQRRRDEQDAMLAEALRDIESFGYAERSAIVLGKPHWNHGIVGIVAGKLAEQFGCPVAVAGFTDGHGRGSVRGPRGVRLFDALSASTDVLERFGGHQAAAGFEVTLENLDAFRDAFERAVEALGPPVTDETGAPIAMLQPGDSPDHVLRDLDRLEPCGPDNPRPKLEVTGTVELAKVVGSGHVKMQLDVGGRTLDCFAINLADELEQLVGTVRVRGDLRRNTFRGVTTAELFVDSVIPMAHS